MKMNIFGPTGKSDRAFASQASAYVIDVGALLSPANVPEAYKDRALTYPGESCIIDPYGEIMAGPAEGETILVADCSTEHIFLAKSLCDVAGHYSRPDVFQLTVNKSQHHRIAAMQRQEQAPPDPETVPEEPISPLPIIKRETADRGAY